MIRGLLLDHHCPPTLANALQARGISCLRAEELGLATAADEVILQEATARGLAVVTLDSDYLRIAADWLAVGRPFSAVCSIRSRNALLKEMVDSLELFIRTAPERNYSNVVQFIPH